MRVSGGKIWVTLGLVVILLVGAACGGDDEGPTSASGNDSLRFIFPNEGDPEIIFYAYWVADDLGYFEDEGLDVTPLGSDGSSGATQQLIAGQADAGIPFSASPLEAASKGLDMRYVYTYSTAQNFGIFVPSESDIEGIEDLEGTTIGITEADGGEIPVIEASLRRVGLEPSDVEMLAIGEGSPSTLAAIEKGEVDAYSSSFGDFLILQTAGLDMRDITPSEFDNYPAHGVSTTMAAIEQKGDALAKLGRAMAKATLFCHTNREACKTILKRLNSAQFEDEALADVELDRLLSITEVPEGEQIGAPNREAWEAYNDFWVETTPDAEPADLDEFLVDDFVDDFNDFDHEAVIEEAENYSE